MSRRGKQPGTGGLRPPQGRSAARPKQRGGKGSFGGYNVQDVGEFADHAGEVRRLASGNDIVELTAPPREVAPAAFNQQDLQVVRSWAQSRPLETNPAAAALIEYPRMWNTKRGRYAKIQVPGAGAYALLRARPTY